MPAGQAHLPPGLRMGRKEQLAGSASTVLEAKVPGQVIRPHAWGIGIVKALQHLCAEVNGNERLGLRHQPVNPGTRPGQVPRQLQGVRSRHREAQHIQLCFGL
jgi:hypothetical protein